jgi:hypothetical protein
MLFIKISSLWKFRSPQIKNYQNACQIFLIVKHMFEIARASFSPTESEDIYGLGYWDLEDH